tara:strand:+ start:228 stop:443 length:216 start_codon:yes stop_codon:yes gene_type:complete
MDKKDLLYNRVEGYTKFKLTEMFIEKHMKSFKSLNHVEQVTDDVLRILAICGMKFYPEFKNDFEGEYDNED